LIVHGYIAGVHSDFKAFLSVASDADVGQFIKAQIAQADDQPLPEMSGMAIALLTAHNEQTKRMEEAREKKSAAGLASAKKRGDVFQQDELVFQQTPNNDATVFQPDSESISDSESDPIIQREREKKPRQRGSSPAPDKLILGEFGNVLLTEDEKRKLEQRLGPPCTADYIEQLSSYFITSGKDYQSHYAAILRWWRRDKDSLKLESGRRPGRSPSRHQPQFQVGSVSTIRETPEERRARFARLVR